VRGANASVFPCVRRPRKANTPNLRLREANTPNLRLREANTPNLRPREANTPNLRPREAYTPNLSMEPALPRFKILLVPFCQVVSKGK